MFNDNFHDKGFRNAILDVTKGACEAFHQKKFKLQDLQLDLEGIKTQTPRPWLTPHLEESCSRTLEVYSFEAQPKICLIRVLQRRKGDVWRQ